MRKGKVPLERALSKLGLASRAEARALIRGGRVAVEGRPVADPLFEVVPERARIEIDGRPAERPRPTTVLLHKPRGVVTTRSDPEGRPTVYGCLEGLDIHVVPVGRLDAATSGLLLLTNDTRFADWVTDPRNEVPRVYLVTVRGELSDEEARRLEGGVEDEGERLAARSVTVRKRSKRETHLVVELTEGKNREIRRMLAVVGNEVTKLKRVSFGGLDLGNLPPGEWREVGEEEVRRAFPGAPSRQAAFLPQSDGLRLKYEALRREQDQLRLKSEALRPQQVQIRLKYEALRREQDQLRLKSEALRPQQE